jgi:hypothetical protein
MTDSYISTAVGKVWGSRCQARSKRTGIQCNAPAERGKKVCRFTAREVRAYVLRMVGCVPHSVKPSTGSKRAKPDLSGAPSRPRSPALKKILYVINAATSQRTRGAKPVSQAPIKTLLAAYLYMA